MVLARDVEHQEHVRGATECLMVTPCDDGGLLPDGLIRRMRGFSLDQHSVDYSNLYRLWVELLVADDLSAGEAADAAGEIARTWLGRSRTAHAKPSRWLERASNRLRGCYTEKNVVVNTAEELNISVEHLVRTFRLRFGTTPGQFVRYCRMINATRALVETDAPIAQVALDAGFADQSHLTRLFRLTFRTTPHRYRLTRTWHA